VKECDLFLGVLSTSYGANMEVGAAITLGKPCVLVHTSDMAETFTGRGARESERVAKVTVERLGDLPALIRSSGFLEVLEEASMKSRGGAQL